MPKAPPARPPVTAPHDLSRRAGLWDLAILTVQMGSLLLVAKVYSLENSMFLKVFTLATGGFVVNALLARRLRMPFFVLLSFAGALVVFGTTQGVWLIGLGLGLIGLVHLPVPFSWRIALVLAAGVALALLRGGWWTAPWSSILWPIFGAMFMFRLIVYMYDLRNQVRTSVWATLGYFFMLPNLVFPLFPVVDYKNFLRGHYQKGDIETYQTGMEWMLRGLVQLLLYRLVYQNLSINPGEIRTATEAALYLARPYLLYLKISGSFHLIVGLLHAFGFTLPRTNHNYFLASSFTDYWRRINIYWKEFLQKIFFNPVYLRLNRKLSATTSLVAATLIAFFATWALHSYQWFWIRRSFPVIWQDIVFWSVMGLIVLINMVYESKRGRKRTLRAPTRTLAGDAKLAAKVIGTFVVIFFSWAIWSVPSWDDLRMAVGHLLRPRLIDLVWILGSLSALGVAAVVYDRLQTRQPAAGARPQLRWGRLRLPTAALRVGAAGLALCALAYGSLLFYYPPSLASLVDSARNPLRLSRVDAEMLDRGYYEDLTDVTRFNPELAEIYAERPADWDRCWALHRTGGFPTHELLPSRTVGFKGAMMSTNQWGMRDREYAKAKPANTYRIAVMGASHTMGTGVEDHESFENVAEDRFNAEGGLATGQRVEMLNFSVGGYGPLSRLVQFENQVLDFQPDALVLVAVNDLHWVAKEVCMAVDGTIRLSYPEYVQAAQALDVAQGTTFETCMEKLRPHRERLLDLLYERFALLCQERGIRPFVAGISRVRDEDSKTREDWRIQYEVARRHGFTVIDMTDVYEAAPSLDVLWIAKWDNHPNAMAHRMLADRFHDVLQRELETTTLQ